MGRIFRYNWYVMYEFDLFGFEEKRIFFLFCVTIIIASWLKLLKKKRARVEA